MLGQAQCKHDVIPVEHTTVSSQESQVHHDSILGAVSPLLAGALTVHGAEIVVMSYEACG